MPPERLPGDRKDFFKERKPRWRDSASGHYGSSRDISRWGGSNEFRRPPGYVKLGGWHPFAEESGHGYAPFRSSDRILEEKNFRPSVSRGDNKYGRNGRDNRGSFSQRDWRTHSWELNNGSPNAPGRLHDASTVQRSLDDTVSYPSSHHHSEFMNTWEQLHSKDHHDNGKMVVVNGMGTGQRGDRENSLDWKPLNKWTRSGSLSSRGSGFSHSSSSKSLGGADSCEGKAELQLKNASLVQSPSGDAAACVTSAPSEEMAARKKPRLNWGEGLAKYEKKKVEGPEVNLSKDGVVISSSNIEPIQSQSSNLVEKSPQVMGLSDCASPTTPSSVACSSPGVEEKTSGKGISPDNLCGSPSIGSQSHIEGLSFNLEVLDATSVANLGALLVELLHSDDSSSVDSSFIRSTAMNKLLVLKGGISKALEVTESEIDLLENELKSLKFESGSRYPCLAASSSFPLVDEVKLCSEQGAAANIPRPSPLQVSFCGAGDVEKIPICNGVLEVVHGGSKDDDVDSPGTATSKFVESVSMVKAVSSFDLVKQDARSADGGVIQTATLLKSVLPCPSEQVNAPTCMDVNLLTESKEGASFPSDASCAEDNLFNLILAANKESASTASEVFSNLSPRDECKIEFSEVANAALRQNDALVKEKIAMRKRFLKFKERVITLKLKAFQHLWKEDMRLLYIRKYRAKSQKKYELNLRITHSGYQKNRSSIRSRVSSLVGNLRLVPTTEMLNFTSNLLSVSQLKLCRNALKMPALILDKKERIGSRFISSNGLVEDPCAIEKERAMINPWSSEERETFIDKLATYGKDFRKIASFLDHKTTADCVEFYYKNHKSDCFEKTKKSKQSKSSANYLVASGKNWSREMNAASLDILGAATVIAADVDNGMGNQQTHSGRFYLGGYCNSKPSHGGDGNVDRSSNVDILQNERETVAADVLAGICGSMSSEAMSSCITTSVDPAEGCREWKSQKVDFVKKRSLMADVTQNVDEETCSDESCGEMDPAVWTDEEKSIFIRAVSSYGKDFAMISRCVRTRSRDQCKAFFSKARKCLSLDSIHPGPGNLGTPLSDDANGGGGGSDTEDGGALESGSVICSDKLGSKMDDSLPLPVMDSKLEESDVVERKNLTTGLNRSKDSNVTRQLGENDSRNEKTFVSDACQMDCQPVQTFDIENNGFVRQSELMQAQEISNESVSSEAGIGKPIEDNSVGDTVDPGPSNPVAAVDVKAIVEVSTNANLNHLGAEEILLLENNLNHQSGLLQDSNASRDVSHQPLDMGSCSNFSLSMENTHHASMEFKSVEKSPIVSLLQENKPATANSVLQDSAAIQFRKLSSQLDIQEERDEQGKKLASGDNHLQNLSGQCLVSSNESTQILRGYPLQIPTKRETNGDISCRPLPEVQSLSTSERNAGNQFVGQDCYLQKCNVSQDQYSVPKIPLLSHHTEQGNDHSTDQSRSLSEMEKPCRNGDVKLFGQILTNPSSSQKQNPSINENVEQGTHCPKPGSKSSTLKFTGHQTTDGSSSVLKFDINNYRGLENVPVKSYGFWDGNKIQTGFSSLPEYFLAKYPAAFGNYHVSSSKMEQQALQAVKCNDHNLNSVSVLPPREISGSNGVVDYHIYRSHDSSTVQPYSVDMKQRQDIFSEMPRRNGFDSISSLQEQGRGMVGMNVVGRGGVLVGGPCTGVSDPVAALKMHYSKTEQYGGQNGSIIREEESWRSKGDIGR
ncbi:hypothetical protein P3X46_025404 [Hevea brasiliensis]|uniref:SANT domain-containing protein n=1 Tax=Hevea brasiliensis TaxID=3981 RepID=A0ABQ9L6J6_HEVBR|nr:uncharacterized protein LOC131172523 [Hevea brasiliensis]KAJ9159955.1 hypothetical protein P3X46_025404 [Hevea brasiliensis]KAJ9159956.1 hypothetical protein P3X46_025404 [Hevea brasiliensis]